MQNVGTVRSVSAKRCPFRVDPEETNDRSQLSLVNFPAVTFAFKRVKVRGGYIHGAAMPLGSAARTTQLNHRLTFARNAAARSSDTPRP